MAYELFGDVECEIEINTESSFEPASDGVDIDPGSVLDPPLQYAPGTWRTYPYSCKHCAAQLYSMGALRDHGKTRHGTCLVWNCADCDEDINDFIHFVEHVRGHKEELKQYCPQCDSKLDDPNHTDHESEVCCGYCGELNPDFRTYGHQPRSYWMKEIEEITVRSQRILKYGKEGVTCFSDYPYVCSYCNIKYINRWSLRRHLRRIHEKCFGLVCVDCLEEQSTFQQFVEHVRKHRPILEDNCEYCDTRLADENQYLTHFTTVHKQDYKCFKCGQFFDEESAWTRHKIKYIDSPPNVVCVPTHEGVSPKAKLTCNICGKVYVSQYHLTMHKVRHNEGLVEYKTNICNYCGKHFRIRNHLISHIAKAHDENIGGYHCRLCKQKFYIKTLRDMHVTKIHSAKTFECAECRQRFRIIRDLKRHMISEHKNNKFYPCNYCSESFKIESLWRKHEITHTGRKPFYCSECKIDFETFKLYKKHIKSEHRYSIDRPNYCALCNIDYGFPRNYKQHMNAVHNAHYFNTILSAKFKSGRKPYFCLICNQDYKMPENYLNHMAIVHSDQNEASTSSLKTAGTCFIATATPVTSISVPGYGVQPASSSQINTQVYKVPTLNTLAINAVNANLNLGVNETNSGDNTMHARIVTPGVGNNTTHARTVTPGVRNNTTHARNVTLGVGNNTNRARTVTPGVRNNTTHARNVTLGVGNNINHVCNVTPGERNNTIHAHVTPEVRNNTIYARDVIPGVGNNTILAHIVSAGMGIISIHDLSVTPGVGNNIIHAHNVIPGVIPGGGNNTIHTPNITPRAGNNTIHTRNVTPGMWNNIIQAHNVTAGGGNNTINARNITPRAGNNTIYARNATLGVGNTNHARNVTPGVWNNTIHTHNASPGVSELLNSNTTLVAPNPDVATLCCNTAVSDESIVEANIQQQHMDLTSPVMTIMSPESISNELIVDTNLNQNDPYLNDTTSEWLTLDSDIDAQPPGSDLFFDEDILMPDFGINITLDSVESEMNTDTFKFNKGSTETVSGVVEEFVSNLNNSPPKINALMEEGTDDSNSSNYIDYAIKKEIETDLNSNIIGEVDNNEQGDE